MGNRLIDAYKKNITKSTPSNVAKASELDHAQPYALSQLKQQKDQVKSPEKPVVKKTISPDPIPQKNGLRKSAELLLLVGKDEAAKILKHMSPDEIESIVREIAHIKNLKPEEAKQTLDEFGRTVNQQGLFTGGIDVARGFLKTAFGDEEGERILRNAASDFLDKPFAFLEDLEFAQLMSILKGESVATLSVIIPRLKPSIAKSIIEAMPPYLQPDIIQRIAKMQRIDTKVLMRMEEVLRERIKHQGGRIATEELDGQQALANILRHMTVSDEKKLLNDLANTMPDTAKAIEDQLFTIESILYMHDRDLQDILRNMDDNEIAVLLKGKSEEIRKHILSCVSERKRASIIREEQILGAMLRRDVDRTTREFLENLRQKEKDGKIVLLRPGETLV